MANILDVAALAGVSRTTVSRVLNKSERVDKETREKVLKTIEELGYRPSRVAQSLRRQKTRMIAVMVARVANPYNAVLLQGIEREAAKHDYNVIVCNTENDPSKELQYLKMIQHHQVDGIIMTGLCNEVETVRSFEQFGPIVLISLYTEEQIFPAVTVDNYDAAYSAAVHLLGLGHRKLGMITGRRSILISRDREMGFRQALTDHQVPIVEDWIKESSGYNIENGKRYVDELFSGEELPTAVFASNDELAVGIIQAVKERGLTVPRDMAVVGYDGQFIGTIVEPNLTTVAQPIEELGSTGMSILIRKLKGEIVPAERTVLQTRLVVRESCGYK